MSIDPKANYYDVGGIETIEIIRAKLTPEQYMGYLLGNVIKYSCRHSHKGQPLRDAEKLRVYSTLLNKLYDQGMAVIDTGVMRVIDNPLHCPLYMPGEHICDHPDTRAMWCDETKIPDGCPLPKFCNGKLRLYDSNRLPKGEQGTRPVYP